jgi:putative flippase GtrA
MSVLHSLYQRWRHLVHELAKFGVVGAVNTVLDFGLFNLILLYVGPLKHKPITANAISLTVAATSSYFMNRHWTFRHRARTNVRREYSLFFFLNLVGLLINSLCIWLVRYGFGLQGTLWLNAAKVVGLGVGMVFRFTSYKRWVFLSPEAAAARAVGEGSVAEAEAENQPGTDTDTDLTRVRRR